MVAEFVANNSHRGSTAKEERSESLVEYSVFPSANSESGSFSWIRNGTNPNSDNENVQNPTKHLQDSLIIPIP